MKERSMTVYEWCDIKSEAPGTGQVSCIVAARSKSEAAACAGYKDYRQLFNLRETGNAKAVRVAMAAPGVVFWCSIHDPANEYQRVANQPKPQAKDNICKADTEPPSADGLATIQPGDSVVIECGDHRTTDVVKRVLPSRICCRGGAPYSRRTGQQIARPGVRLLAATPRLIAEVEAEMKTRKEAEEQKEEARRQIEWRAKPYELRLASAIESKLGVLTAEQLAQAYPTDVLAQIADLFGLSVEK